jgi:hypothetical protein
MPPVMVSNSQYGPLVQKDRRYRAGNGLIPANFASFLGKSERTIGFLPHIENCCVMVHPEPDYVILS